MDCSTACSTIHGVSQAKVLEWVPFPSPGDLPDPGIEPASLTSPALQMDSLPLGYLRSPTPLLRGKTVKSKIMWLSKGHSWLDQVK